MTKCYNEAEIESIYAGVGGIVGRSISSTVTYCHNKGKIVVTDGNIDNNAMAGGIIGVLYNANVSYSYNRADLIINKNLLGSIVGLSDETSSISNCYNTGSLTGNLNVKEILGHDAGSANERGKCTIESCYYLGTETVDQQRTESDMKTEEFINLIGGETYWSIDENDDNDGYPILN